MVLECEARRSSPVAALEQVAVWEAVDAAGACHASEDVGRGDDCESGSVEMLYSVHGGRVLVISIPLGRQCGAPCER